jgi:molecular chaperone GrpE
VDAETRAKKQVLKDILEVIDNLERAAAAASGETTDAKGIKDGLALVLRQAQSILDRYQVHAIESRGKPFDPHIHDAISRVHDDSTAPGTIVNELQKGYVMGETLLRPASVIVAVSTPAATPASPDGQTENNGAAQEPAPDQEPGPAP